MISDDVRRHLEAASWARYRLDVRNAIRSANENVPMAERHNWLAGQQVEAECRHYERMSDVRQRWHAALATAEAEFCDRLCREWATLGERPTDRPAGQDVEAA